MKSKHVGKKYGGYTILDMADVRRTPSGAYVQFVKVRCDCGAESVRRLTGVIGNKGDGCRECRGKTHAAASASGCKHPLYHTWIAMIHRCHAPASAAYKYYGARGIGVCDRWRCVTTGARLGTKTGFANFVQDMGERPEGMTLGRIDNDKGYSPDNCRWETPKEQQNNTRQNVRVHVGGVTKTVAQWAEALGVSRDKISSVVKRRSLTYEHVIGRLLEFSPETRAKYIQWAEIKRCDAGPYIYTEQWKEDAERVLKELDALFEEQL